MTTWASIAAGGAAVATANRLHAATVSVEKTGGNDDLGDLYTDAAQTANSLTYVHGQNIRQVNISDFGAVSGSDCSEAVQRAVDYVESLGGYDVRDSGGVVEFGPGIWYISRVFIGKFGIRFVGAGRRATLIANRSKTEPMLVINQGNRSVTPVIADIDFENLQFRNTVHREDCADFLIFGKFTERLLFNNVDFVSSPLAPNGNRSPLRCSFIKADTFQSRWSNCNFWGILGCAIEIPDDHQADTILFDGCVWAYCSVAGLFGLGKGAGNNGIYFVSCKIIGNQGGHYVSSSSDNFAQTVALVSGTGNEIRVRDAVNFSTNQTVILGQNPDRAQYAFVREISGNSIKLDRRVKVDAGDVVVQGRFGFVFGHVSMPRIQSSQFEGCDVGVYMIGGRRLTVDSTIIASCARGILIGANFDYLKINMCTGVTRGEMKNDVAWQLLTISNIKNDKNVIKTSGTSVYRSGYEKNAEGGFVVNVARFPVRQLSDD